MFCFNCAALSSEYKVAHKHTTTRDKGDLDRILDIVYSGYFSHHGITFFQSLTFTTFAMHSVLTNEENIWQLEDCTARLYLNSLSVFIWCELDYSCQSEAWCCWVVSLGKGGTTEISRPPRSSTRESKDATCPLEKLSSSRPPFDGEDDLLPFDGGLAQKRIFLRINHQTSDRVIFLQEDSGFQRPVSWPSYSNNLITFQSDPLEHISWKNWTILNICL